MRWQGALVAAVIAALVGLSYAPAARLGFIYDDHELIVEREAPRGPGEIARVFAERHWPTLPYYRPIPRASMLVQKALHGDEPAAYHVLNAILIAAIALAALALLRTGALALPWPLALFGALGFALHPVASSCVYPIASGRETLWPTLFEICALVAFLRPGARASLAALLATAAALLSKEHAVILPVIFVAADALRLSAEPPRGARAWLRRYLPYALLFAGYFAARALIFAGERGTELAVFREPLGPLLSLLYALQVAVAPTRELVYEPTVEVWLSPTRLALALGAVLALGWAIAARAADAGRRAAFWVVWLLAGLLPTANFLVQDARFDERYVFFSALGAIALALTACAPHWRAGVPRALVSACAIALIALAAATSVGRAAWFADDAVFLARWIESDPQRAQPHISLGKLAARAGDWPASIAHFEAALARAPESAEVHNGLGLAHEALGRVELAERSFARALELDPGNSLAHNNLGVLFLSRGELAAAQTQFERALAARGDHLAARINLALVHARRGARAEAIAELERVIGERPGHAGARFNLGVLYAGAGDDARAAESLERALDSRPDYALAHLELAAVLARLGRASEADEHRRRALELDPALAASSS